MVDLRFKNYLSLNIKVVNGGAAKNGKNIVNNSKKNFYIPFEISKTVFK